MSSDQNIFDNIEQSKNKTTWSIRDQNSSNPRKIKNICRMINLALKNIPKKRPKCIVLYLREYSFRTYLCSPLPKKYCPRTGAEKCNSNGATFCANSKLHVRNMETS